MWGFLSEREAVYCQRILDEFQRDNFLPALARTVQEQGGLTSSAMPFLFELRYAKCLKEAGITSDYEVMTVHQTTVDFSYAAPSGSRVLAELVSIAVSDAVNEATVEEVDEDGIPWASLVLSSNNEDPRFSEEGEVLLVQQKICEKVFRGNAPIKFPVPADNGDIHILAADMRGFLGGNGGDHRDYIQMTFGNGHVDGLCQRFWTNPQGERVPILGLFEDTQRPRGAPTLRERIHGILFVRDTGYESGSFLRNCSLIHNPHLITSQEQHAQLQAAVLLSCPPATEGQ